MIVQIILSFFKNFSTSDIIQLCTAIATFSLALIALKQILYLKSEQKPILNISRLSYREYFLFNYGKSPAYEIFVEFNKNIGFSPIALETSKHLLITIHTQLMPNGNEKKMKPKTNLLIFYKHKFTNKHEKIVFDLSNVSKIEKSRVTDELIKSSVCNIKVYNN